MSDRVARITKTYDEFTSRSFNDIEFDANNNPVRLVDIEHIEPAPALWNFYEPLPESKMLELIDSIERHGLLSPIFLWEQDIERFMTLAGHNRIEAYKRLYKTTHDNKYKTILAIIKKRDELNNESAQEIIIDTNWISRTLSLKEKSKSISVKYSILSSKSYKSRYGDGSIKDIIAKDYNISGRQVLKYRKIGESLHDDLMNIFNEGKISVNNAVKLCDLTKENQENLFKEYKDKINNKFINNLHIIDGYYKLQKPIQKIDFRELKIDEFIKKLNDSDKEKFYNDMLKLMDTYKKEP